jgi:ketosteroid isomerase-like protein
MSTRSVLLAVLALALALASTACQAPAQEAAGLSEEDVAAIRGASQAWAEAFKADDDAAAVAFATEDAVLMPPNMPAFQGHPALEEYVASFTVTDFSVTRLEIDGLGDLADGSWLIAVQIWNSDQPLPEEGSET